ncbi:UNVERIFIED_ORG: hypothetical protein J2W74_002030 [Methylorubrum zatmanii]
MSRWPLAETSLKIAVATLYSAASGFIMIRVPVLIAVSSPLTAITLDENDKFELSLEDINSLSYDRLKLCRSTMTVDGGLGVLGGDATKAGVIVSFTGAMLFPLFKGVDRAFVLSSANKVIFEMLLGGIPFDAISPDDIGFGEIYGTGYFMLTGGAEGANYNFLMSLQQVTISNYEAIKLYKLRSYTKTEIAAAIEKGTSYAKCLSEINPSLFLDGLTHLRRRQLPSALIFIWSTAEFLLSRIWQDRIIPQGTGITGRKRFVESNQWQAAHRAEVLFQIGIIDEQIYNKLNIARSARNTLAHRGEEPGEDVCLSGLGASLSLMSLIVSSYSDATLFDHIGKRHRSEETEGPSQPLAWRHIKAVPGHPQWDETEFPRHPELELVPLKASKGDGDGAPN